MSASLTGIYIEQRACFDLTLSIQKDSNPYNLSGVNLTGVIRRDFDDQLQAVFQTDIVNIESGIAKISLSGAATANIDLSPCSWELYADNQSGCSDKLYYGPVYVAKNNTY